jgi:hypothetical protein
MASFCIGGGRLRHFVFKAAQPYSSKWHSGMSDGQRLHSGARTPIQFLVWARGSLAIPDRSAEVILRQASEAELKSTTYLVGVPTARPVDYLFERDILKMPRVLRETFNGSKKIGIRIPGFNEAAASTRAASEAEG